MSQKYLRPREVTEILGITYRTLQTWTREKKIEYITRDSGRNLYLEDSVYSHLSGRNNNDEPKEKIIYARVSSRGQKEDLERQSALLKERYPSHRVIKDIGSGLNSKRKGFKTVLDLAINGRLKEVVVTHKDRLVRFNFEMFEYIIKSKGGRILVLYDRETSPLEELTEDIISIVQVFSSRLYGLRSWKIKKELERGEIKDFKDTDFPVKDGEGEDRHDDITV